MNDLQQPAGSTTNLAEGFPGLLATGQQQSQQQTAIRINQMNFNENYNSPNLIEQSKLFANLYFSYFLCFF